MSQERAKTKEKKTAKEDRSGSVPYMVMVDIDENERKAEGRVSGEMPAENIPLMISDFIMQTAMMEVEMDGSACPYDAMDKINEMVTYIAGGFAAIAGVRSTGGNSKAVRFINGTFHDFRRDAHTQITFTPYEDEEFGTQYHVEVYGTPVFSPWKVLLALAEIADERMEGMSLPSVLIACNAAPIISSMMDEIVSGSFDCNGICDECPVSGDDDGYDERRDEDHDEDDTDFVFSVPQDMPC